MDKRISLPLTAEDAASLRCGDRVFFTGTLYTARDAAHARLTALIESSQTLPFELRDAVLYYVGPTPAKPNEPIGAAGPTTSYRMDSFTPLLLDNGLRGMIGKGRRSKSVIDAMRRNGAVYFGAVGGAGALLASHVLSSKIIAFEELGPEAVFALKVADFPATVVIDNAGNDLYESGPDEYLRSLR